MRNNVLLCFLKNICALWRCDIYRDISELKYQQKLSSEKLSCVDARELLFEIQTYYDVHTAEANKYKDELYYLKQNGLTIFPYKQIFKSNKVETAYDKDVKLPYVVHKSKRLYFPMEYSGYRMETVYRRLYEIEGISGEGIMEKNPHQYQSKIFKIEEGDVLVDVGCAEGLLSLDVIDRISKVYLIESDLRWMPALKATFAPYKDKVVLVPNLITDVDSESTITLSTLLKKEHDSSLFIKMDIEGYETQVIESSRDFFIKHPKAKFTCCTYHKANDAEILENLFKEYGYETEFSDGYMLFLSDCLTQPYFRKGVIRAKKI